MENQINEEKLAANVAENLRPAHVEHPATTLAHYLEAEPTDRVAYAASAANCFVHAFKMYCDLNQVDYELVKHLEIKVIALAGATDFWDKFILGLK